MFAAAGIAFGDVQRSTQAGALCKLRRGWYALPDADPTIARAVTAGGALTCVSALQWYGVWTPATSYLHVRIGRAPRGEVQPGITVCHPSGRSDTPKLPIDPLPVALASAASCLEPDDLVVVMDSLVNLRLISRRGLVKALEPCGPALVQLVDLCDDAESGTETLTRLRLRCLRIPVRPQVLIPGVGRVDLLVGRWLVLECDSRRHHTDAVAYQADRDRDRRLAALGFVVIRLTYADVIHRWDQVEREILTVVRQGRHLYAPRGLSSTARSLGTAADCPVGPTTRQNPAPSTPGSPFRHS